MWSSQEVIDYYDSHLNVTLHELAAMSGWYVHDINQLLRADSGICKKADRL